VNLSNILDISKKYDSLYMRKRRNMAWRGEIIAGAVNDVLHPKTVIDFGCGIGDIVKGFEDIGVIAYGIDGSSYAVDYLQFDIKYFRLFDITKQILTFFTTGSGKKVDLAICIEVFGVIDHNKWDGLIENLIRHSDLLLIGCGKGKRRNLQSKLYDKGYKRQYIAEEMIKEKLEEYKHKLAVKALYNGLMIWSRR